MSCKKIYSVKKCQNSYQLLTLPVHFTDTWKLIRIAFLITLDMISRYQAKYHIILNL